ncbi:MAG TPA: murein biosynthesis integral membrane protein MurJ [Rhizomicrobium sp.]|jgi:putative peptidoglycan lipid II flippase|nr:murein biosynthesis integral membrane protein MurJ [Rhizomicrobium sp.]
MLKKLISVSGFTLLSRITGFARDALLAWTLGAGLLSDAFFVAFLFPNYFRSIFGEGTINPAFLPRYAALHAKGEHQDAARFANAVFAWQMAAQVVLLVLATLFMPLVIRVLAPGWSGAQFDLTVSLARVTFPYLIMTLVAVQLSAMLNAINRFWAGAFWSNLQNLAMIATLLLYRWFPNAGYAAAWGVFAGGVAQLVFILWAGAREGLWLKITWPRWTPEIREFFVAFGAVTFGATSVVIAPFIDTILASLLPTGSRTALYYADRINQLPQGVFGIALGTVLLPEMSARLAKGDTAGSDAAQNRSAAMSLLLTLPFMVTFLLIPGTIIRAVFLHGAFNAQAAQLASWALMAYGTGLPAMAMLRIVQATFYARHDTLTPARSTVIALISNILLKLLFVWGFSLGVAGLALGTALGAWINVALLTVTGRSRALIAIETQFLRALPASLLAAIACGAGAWLGAMLLNGRGDVAALGGAMAMAALAYGGTLLVLRRRLPLKRAA